jgi:hypothetical protein
MQVPFDHEYMCMLLVSFIPIIIYDDREHCPRTRAKAWKT